MKAAVIGCLGAMGSYFVDQFLLEGYRVTGSDSENPGSRRRFTFTRSNSRAAEKADVVLLAVPIRETVRVAREVAPHMAPGSTLVEISSVKSSILPSLREVSKESGVKLLSLHPLFGGSTAGDEPKVCVIGGPKEASLALRLLPRARLLRMTIERHERMMAYALTLVHVVNMAFASAVAKGPGVEEFGLVATPTGRRQLETAKMVLSQNPTLYSYIESENPYSGEALELVLESLRELSMTIASKDKDKFEKEFTTLSREFMKLGQPKGRRAVGRVT